MGFQDQGDYIPSYRNQYLSRGGGFHNHLAVLPVPIEATQKTKFINLYKELR